MNAMIEALACIETVSGFQPAHELVPAHSTQISKLRSFAPPSLRQAKPYWCSTLDNADLQCLLRVIEIELIPQLLNSYSPARHAPDERLASG